MNTFIYKFRGLNLNLWVREKIIWQFWALRRPTGKARKRWNIVTFRVFATQSDGMHRRLKYKVIFERALS